MRPRVAFDFTHAVLNRTGLGRYPSELFPALQLEDVDLVRIQAAPGVPSSSAERIARGLWREGVYYPAALARRAAAAGAQLIHVPTPAPVRGGRIPTVVTVHDLLPLRMPQYFTRQTRAHTQLSLPFLRKADAILTNSQWTRGEVIELAGIPSSRVFATPFGVSARFRPTPLEPVELAERFGLTERFVLTVATREPRKNLKGVLAAFARVAREIPDVQLALVGGRGWRVEDLEHKLAVDPDRLRVLGFVDDQNLVGLYSSAAAFLFPSFAEGFGFPPLEAMACGVPVVTSDRAALPEITGDAAMLVDPAAPEEIAEAVVRLLDDSALAASLRRRGFERATAHTWERCARATLTVYRQVVDRAG